MDANAQAIIAVLKAYSQLSDDDKKAAQGFVLDLLVQLAESVTVPQAGPAAKPRP